MLLPALLLPWLALLAIGPPRLRAAALIVAPLPLALLAFIDVAAIKLPPLLLGASFAVDAGNRPLLLLAGVGWSLAAAFVGAAVRRHPMRFAGFWLLTLAGQAIALLAADLASFYCGYALMTLASYGLIVHRQSDAAWRAGRVYLLLALTAEMAILAGLLTLAAANGNARFDTLDAARVGSLGAAPWLLLAGFALKLGVAPLHVWLPLAHPVAPVPASAMLSGVLVKTGLLGMLRLLPAGSVDAELLVAIGLAGAGYGALVGLTQTRLKTVLAYSTVSQMGLALAAFGALQAAGNASAASDAVLLFALQHGLNKAALFIAAGHRLHGRLAHALFLMPALALAGLPLSAGALAKDALKATFDGSGFGGVTLALSLASALTTALLLHAYRLAREDRHGRQSIHPAWPLLVVAGVLLPWLWAWPHASVIDVGRLWGGLWPVLLGAAGHAVVGRMPGVRMPPLPEGDLLLPFERAARVVLPRLVAAGERWRDWQPQWPFPRTIAAQATRRAEQLLLQLPVAGIGLLLVLGGVWLLLRYP